MAQSGGSWPVERGVRDHGSRYGHRGGRRQCSAEAVRPAYSVGRASGTLTAVPPACTLCDQDNDIWTGCPVDTAARPSITDPEFIGVLLAYAGFSVASLTAIGQPQLPPPTLPQGPELCADLR